MKNISRILIVFLLTLGQRQSVVAQESHQVDHLVAFAKLAGDIQFFSPSDAANRLIWWKYYPHFVKSVLGAPDERSFADTLIAIFQPIEPGLSIRYKDQALLAGDVAQELKPLVVTTQHVGLDLWSGLYRRYRSIRTNRRSMTAAVDMLETRVTGISVPADTLVRPVKVSFRYTAGDIPMTASVSREGKTLRLDSLGLSDSVYVFNDTLQPGVRNVSMIVYADPDKDFSLAFDTLLVDKGYGTPVRKPAGPDSTEYTVEFFSNDLPLYEERHKTGDMLDISLTGDIAASFPLAVYADKKNTYPISVAARGGYRFDNEVFEAQADLTLHDKHLRMANVIQVWNAMRLSYAYFPLDGHELDRILAETLEACLGDITLKEYHKAVWSMLSEFKDSHIFFSIDEVDAARTHSVPMQLLPLEEKVYIKKLEEPALGKHFDPGDEVLALDGVPVRNVIDSLKALTSGADRHRTWLAVHRLLHGPENSTTDIRVKKASTGKIVDIQTARAVPRDGYPEGIKLTERKGKAFISPTVYYFDLTTQEADDTLVEAMNNPDMAVIIDMRGYVSGASAPDIIMENLLKDTVAPENVFTPKIYGPGDVGWTGGPNVYAPGPNKDREKAQFFFLTDVSAMSAPETMLDIIKTFKLGTIIGQPTAGGNGAINGMYLPGGMSVTFSGQVFKNSDGSTHHLQGVQPDYLVDYSYEDVLTGTDPFLQKALAVIGENDTGN